MALAHSPRIVIDGLVLCLDAANQKSYPGSGTTWTDLSGRGNNGTLSGVGYNSSNLGYLTFDGTDDEVICTNNASVQITVGTISAWFNANTGNTGVNGIIAKQSAWGLFVWDNTLRAYDWGNGVDRNTGITVGNSTWNYAAMTFTETVGTPSNNAIIYLNGSAVLTTTVKHSNHGVTVQVGEANAGQHFGGNIAQVSIYNRALTAQEIQQNFNALKSRYFGYQSVTYTASANMTLTNNGTQDVTMFKNTNNNSWNGEVRSTESFSAPCTIEFSKQSGTTDNLASYLMIGWNEDPTTNASYTSLDHASYPYQQNEYAVYNNGVLVLASGVWDANKRFYIVYDTDGFIRHYNGSTLLYSANYGTNKTVFVDSSFYSVNSTFGGLTNVKVARSSWNGNTYV